MKEVSAPVRTIHPEVIKLIGERCAFELLGIAADLRSGKIMPENFDMSHVYWKIIIAQYINKTASFYSNDLGKYGSCGTPCCILGHLRMRLKDPYVLQRQWDSNRSLADLFDAENPSDPQKAANAIENYIYNNANYPWA